MDLGPNERVDRKESIRTPPAPTHRDNSSERERSTERRDPGRYHLTQSNNKSYNNFSESDSSLFQTDINK